jgi:WD40 repeat protein
MNNFLKDGSLPHRTCHEWADLLALTPEEQLSPADRAAFLHHVQSCPNCATMCADYCLITAYLRRSLTVTPLLNLPSPILAAMQRGSSLPSPGELTPPAVSKNPFFGRLSTLLIGTHRSLSVHRRLAVASIMVVIGVIFLVSLTWLSISQGGSSVQAASLLLHQSLEKPQPGATWVHTVSWSPNEKYIAVLWDDSIMQVLDAATDKEIFSQNVGWGYGLAWSPNSQFLASVGREDNTIQLWNISTQQCETNTLQSCLIYTQHTAKIEAIAWSPDGNFIASASDDGTVQVWNARTMKQRSLYRDLGSKVTSIAWSPNGKRLVSGDENGRIQAWDALTGAHLVSYIGHRGGITSVSWSSDGNSIASSSYDGTLRIWNVTTDASDLILRPSNCNPVFAAIWAPQGTYLALACYDGSVQVWSITHQQGKEVGQRVAANLNGGKRRYNGVFTIAWSPQGNQLIAGGSGNILTFKLGD